MGYVDPGVFGVISQVGYFLLFILVSGFMFFFNPLKKLVKRLSRRAKGSDARLNPTGAEDAITTDEGAFPDRRLD